MLKAEEITEISTLDGIVDHVLLDFLLRSIQVKAGDALKIMKGLKALVKAD